ncbi:MAG: UpxY family transcription antiterminator [Prevotellaceae bacterium]|nr:UpxY family transcription antiterminator [Candidatus Faecinaster equi]
MDKNEQKNLLNDESKTTAVMNTGDAVGVPDGRFWCVGIVNCRNEKKVAERVAQAGYEVYLPLRKETHFWSLGRRRNVETVVISSRLFLHVTEKERLQLLREHLGVLRYMTNIAAANTNLGNKPIAHIPDAQMKQMQMILDNSSSPVDFSELRFVKGEKVRIMCGPLKDLEGIIKYDSQGKARIYVIVDTLGNFNTEIDATDVEKI